MSQLSYDQFRSSLNSRFQVRLAAGQAHELELTTVSERKLSSQQRASETVELETFSIAFRGSAQQPLGQGIYRFEHERLGEFDLFIVPIAADRENYTYEAVFNRRVGPEASEAPSPES
ncbi:MAG TPA: hypothetical protein VGB99_14410 [Acidobacteriota bacterium]